MHVQKSKFCGNICKFCGKPKIKLNPVEFMEFVFSRSKCFPAISVIHAISVHYLLSLLYLPTLHGTRYKLHTEHCTLHTAHCTLHTSHCTQHTAHCTLHSAHCTLHTKKTHTQHLKFCSPHFPYRQLE